MFVALNNYYLVIGVKNENVPGLGYKTLLKLLITVKLNAFYADVSCFISDDKDSHKHNFKKQKCK